MSRCVFLLCGALAATGCTEFQKPEQVERAEKSDTDVFMHEQLESEHVVTVAEAYRAMLMLADGEDKPATFEQREETLVCRGIVRTAWELQRDDAIDRGSVAYMAMRIMEIKGGVNCQTLGRLGVGDRRYAVRELAYRDLMPLGFSYRFITGGELVDLMARADEYMAKHGRYEQKNLDIEQEVDQQKKAAASRPKP